MVIIILLVLLLIFIGIGVSFWVSFISTAGVTTGLERHPHNHNPDTIYEQKLRAKLYKATHYWSLINSTTQTMPPGVLRDRAMAVKQETAKWLQAMFTLAQQVDKLYVSLATGDDVRHVALAIQKYQHLLQQESNPQVCRQLEQALKYKQQQQQSLLSVQQDITRINHQFDITLAALGHVHAQLLLMANKRAFGDTGMARLQTEVAEQINQLQDLTEAMNEVYLNSRKP